MRKKLPIGIDSFEKLRENDFYYVDKTDFIRELLENWGEVNLFTRPRRFGKSLNMSMLKHFFEIGGNPSLFDGLAISREKELCEKYMGKYPVISLTLKDVSGRDYESACAGLKRMIGREAGRFLFLLESDRLTEDEKAAYRGFITYQHGEYTMSENEVISSLHMLSSLLSKHYGKKVILLMDEYDVPLDKAFQEGYYKEMVMLIRNMFNEALKTNEYLEMAVLTGCLRISKESIFTGLNNPKVHTIIDNQYNEHFGFTEAEVSEMLDFYGLSKHADTIREWYNGYRFGNVSVYCPWDVINHCAVLLSDEKAYPRNYWANSSGNAMVRRFIDKAENATRQEIEQLIEGKSVVKRIHMELTYGELDDTIDNLWSVLFTTGYLTVKSIPDENHYELVIPNREILSLFIDQIKEWFRDTSRRDTSRLERFCSAVISGSPEALEEQLCDYLWDVISVRDSASRKEYKENFYHGMILGLLQYEDDWHVFSNMESGVGYSDILIETRKRTGVVIELKYADSEAALSKACEEALRQIEEKRYEDRLKKDGMKEIIKFGIGCYRKLCRVVRG